MPRGSAPVTEVTGPPAIAGIGAAVRLFNGIDPPGVDFDRPGSGVQPGNRILERIKTERRIRIATDKQNHGVFLLEICLHIIPKSTDRG